MSFLTDEQKDLANEIAALLTERGETVCVAESTTGGLRVRPLGDQCR